MVSNPYILVYFETDDKLGQNKDNNIQQGQPKILLRVWYNLKLKSQFSI